MKKRISKKGKRILSALFIMTTTIAVGFVLAKHINPASANNSDQQPMNQTDYFISQIGEPARQLGQDNDLYASRYDCTGYFGKWFRTVWSVW